jgi:endo-1,4-beta-xylanase
MDAVGWVMRLITRRSALATAGALSVSCLAKAAMTDLPLRAAAREGGRSFGAALQIEQLDNDPAFRKLVLAECDSLTPELVLKWAAIHLARDRFEFGPMDRLAGFAQEHHKRIHGHTLLWHRSIPAWAQSEMAAPGGWNIIQSFFAAVMQRYGQVVRYWDVVNEPVEPMDDADGLRRSPFLSAFGPDYVRRALETARACAPAAQIMINEYGLDYPDAEDEARRTRLLRLLDDLRRQGVPLDGLGIQAHLRLDRGAIDQSVLSRFLQELADRGLFLLITELDVREIDPSLDFDRRDQAVAAAARAFLDVVLDQPAVRGISTWGLSDRYSWLNEDGETGTRQPGGNRGLPYDSELRPKAMCRAMASSLSKARPFKLPYSL